tara:strand:- start:211 stop:471 length:261 start_codon:yes stop_codon:yes gene_type:complete
MSFEYHVRPGDMFKTIKGAGFITAKKNGQIEYDVIGSDLSLTRPRVNQKIFYSQLDAGKITVFPLHRKYRRKRKISPPCQDENENR